MKFIEPGYFAIDGLFLALFAIIFTILMVTTSGCASKGKLIDKKCAEFKDDYGKIYTLCTEIYEQK